MSYRNTPTAPSAGDGSSTATLEAAREHARRQAAAAAGTVISVPASQARDLPDGVEASRVVWDEVLPAGGYAARRLPRGAVLRVTDLEGLASVALVVHRAEHPAERLNVADTVKVQWQAYLQEHTVLLSGMGRVLMTIIADTAAGHDALCGCTTAATSGGVWSDRPNGRDLLCLGLAKWGLGRRDLPPNLTLFTPVRVGADGSLHLERQVRPGAFVELRAELDVLVTLANTVHPLDDRDPPMLTPARLTAWRAEPPGPDDPVRTSSPERERAFLNNDELLAGGAR
jgi:urea carboxylase-associated protein 2